MLTTHSFFWEGASRGSGVYVYVQTMRWSVDRNASSRMPGAYEQLWRLARSTGWMWTKEKRRRLFLVTAAWCVCMSLRGIPVELRHNQSQVDLRRERKPRLHTNSRTEQFAPQTFAVYCLVGMRRISWIVTFQKYYHGGQFVFGFIHAHACGWRISSWLWLTFLVESFKCACFAVYVIECYMESWRGQRRVWLRPQRLLWSPWVSWLPPNALIKKSSSSRPDNHQSIVGSSFWFTQCENNIPCIWIMPFHYFRALTFLADLSGKKDSSGKDRQKRGEIRSVYDQKVDLSGVNP